MLVSIYSEFLSPKFLVAGDPAATAQRIAGGELAYRVGILSGFVTHVVFLVVVVSLYRLLKEVDEGGALLMVVLVAVGVAVALANMLLRFAPLVLLGDASVGALGRSQAEALAIGSFGLRSAGANIPMMFWGLWLFPFGWLVYRSQFLPRALGALILVAGVAYLLSGAVAIALPEYRQAVSRAMTPLYFGEVPIIFWLMIKGAREAREALAWEVRGATP
jgi:hypothetical protein